MFHWVIFPTLRLFQLRKAFNLSKNRVVSLKFRFFRSCSLLARD